MPLRIYLFSQFTRPRGWVGWVVGHLLAVKNKKRSLWVLSLLDLRPTDRVLEIGFGPGADIQRVASRVPHGAVAGIDHSEAMVRQASSRNAQSIGEHRVELRQGVASELPYASDYFDVAFAINVAQFWNNQPDVVRELRRVLKPGGRIALAVQPRDKNATEVDTEKAGKKLREALHAAGLASVRLERKQVKPVSIVCALGIK